MKFAYKIITCISAPAIIITALSSFAQVPSKAIPVFIGFEITIHSKILNEDREILICLPRGYDMFNNRYPVLYVTDGNANFHHVSGTVAFLSQADRIPQMIVVAIPHRSRHQDMQPPFEGGYKPEKGEYAGQADKFARFISDELIPYIDQNYRTEPYRIYVGHSLGANFGIYSMYAAPGLFNAYIAISPGLGRQNDLLIKNTRKYLKANPDINKFLYLTLGDEGDDMLKPMQRFVQMLVESAPEGLQWKYSYLRNDNHVSTPLISLYDGLELLFRDWNLPPEIELKGLDAVEKHYQKISEKFGFKVNPPEYTLNRMGYRALNRNDVEAAIATFKRNVKLYPNSANVYDSLGDAFEKAGQYQLAVDNFGQAVQKGTNSKDPNTQFYQMKLDRVKAKLPK